MRTVEFHRPKSAGFTLVELMTVVVVIAIVGFLAVRIGSRAGRGEKAPAFARSVLAAVHRARQAAMANGRPTRIIITAHGFTTEFQQTDGTYSVMENVDPTANGIELCDAAEGVQQADWLAGNRVGGSPAVACPAAGTSTVMFGKGACTAVTANSNTMACLGTSTLSGATMYFRARNDEKHYRVQVWGLTGMPRLIDQ